MEKKVAGEPATDLHAGSSPSTLTPTQTKVALRIASLFNDTRITNLILIGILILTSGGGEYVYGEICR